MKLINHPGIGLISSLNKTVTPFFNRILRTFSDRTLNESLSKSINASHPAPSKCKLPESSSAIIPFKLNSTSQSARLRWSWMSLEFRCHLNKSLNPPLSVDGRMFVFLVRGNGLERAVQIVSGSKELRTNNLHILNRCDKLFAWDRRNS